MLRYTRYTNTAFIFLILQRLSSKECQAQGMDAVSRPLGGSYVWRAEPIPRPRLQRSHTSTPSMLS